MCVLAGGFPNGMAWFSPLSLGCDIGHLGSAVQDTAWQALAGQPARRDDTAVFSSMVCLRGSQSLSHRPA